MLDYSAPGFNAFWERYPKKVGKGDAYRVWVKLEPKPEDISAILTALAWQCRQAQWVKDGGQYIPNASTYLYQERWLDEPVGKKPLDLFPKPQSRPQVESEPEAVGNIMDGLLTHLRQANDQKEK